jgi:TM2 domain-containing membrane protein YozV
MTQLQVTVPLKSTGVAYLWWFFLGYLGAHKFYLGRPGWGIVYALTCGLLFVGIIWDLFALPGQVRRANDRMVEEARMRYGGR